VRLDGFYCLELAAAAAVSVRDVDAFLHLQLEQQCELWKFQEHNAFSKKGGLLSSRQ